MSLDAMKQALEALEPYARQVVEKGDDYEIAKCDPKVDAAITALRLAIEQAEKQDQIAVIEQEALKKIHAIEDAIRRKVYNLPPAAPEQAERQEPVAWMHWLHGPVRLFMNKDEAMMELARLNREYPVDDNARQMRPLYTAPPQRQPLTEEEKAKLCKQFPDTLTFNAIHAIERAHGIGGEHD